MTETIRFIDTNIAEPVSQAILALVFFVVIIGLVVKVFQPFYKELRIGGRLDAMYKILEMKYLIELAKKKNIDLEKELLRFDEIDNSKTLRSEVRKTMFDDMFPKKEGKK